MKLLLLVNTAASSVTARGQVLINMALSAEHDVEMAETSRRGHATRLAQGAAAQGVDAVVVLGGDGTLNEAATGLAGTDTALATLPGGSTNVFARTIGLPNEPVEATSVILEALAADSIERVGLGEVDGRYFCFHTGIGYDAAVVEQVEKRASLKRYAGHPLFVYAALDTWMRHYDRGEPHLSVRHPDGEVIDDGYLTIVLNTSPYTYLGNRGLDLAEEATLDRGLVVITVRTLSLLPLLRVIGAALGLGGDLRSSRDVDFRADVEAVTIEGHGPVPYQVDGDHLGDAECLELRHAPDILNLVLPQSMT